MDEKPVRKSDKSILKSLEVNGDIEELLARGWILETFSSYCSHVVFVRKKKIHLN